MRRKRLSLILAIVFVAVFVGMVAYAANLTPRRVAKRVTQGELVSPSGPRVPSPGDTIKYHDGGGSGYIVWYKGSDTYWAVRFTPTQNCTVKEVHCCVYFDGTAPTCTVLVWDDNSGVPGTPVFSTSFVASYGWNYISVTSPITYPESTDFWGGYFLPTFDTLGADTIAAFEDLSLDSTNRNYVNVGGTWYSCDDHGHPGDLFMNAYVEYVQAVLHDVGTDSITNPPDTVNPDSSFIPTAWVHNYGDSSEVFGVECIINPGAYGDTFVVMGLAPGADLQCVFDQWTVPPPDSTNYTMCVAALLAGDTDPGNDTLCKNVFAVTPAIHDVGVDSIVSPPDTVDVGLGYSPSAWVQNYGDYTEIFQVFCEIDSGGFSVYADTEAVFNLDPGNSLQVTFMLWTVPPPGGVTYNTSIWTELPDDANSYNDSLSKSSYSVTGVAEAFNARRPASLILHQNMPNPFSRTTTIAYEVPVSARVNLFIYDATGSLVRTLVDREADAGYYSTIWNGRNDSGSLVPDGVYFCKLSVGEAESTAKVVFVR